MKDGKEVYSRKPAIITGIVMGLVIAVSIYIQIRAKDIIGGMHHEPFMDDLTSLLVEPVPGTSREALDALLESYGGYIVADLRDEGYKSETYLVFFDLIPLEEFPGTWDIHNRLEEEEIIASVGFNPYKESEHYEDAKGFIVDLLKEQAEKDKNP